MIRSLRHVAVAAAMLSASGAFAATELYEFKTFYDTSTLSFYDTKTLNYSVALMKIEDVTGGVRVRLTLNDTAFPNASGKSLYVDELWLAGAKKGAYTVTSGAALDTKKSGYYASGFTEERTKFNYDLDFQDGKLTEGTTTTLTILGSGVSTATFGGTGQPIMLELANVGSPYRGLLGLNNNVRFIGTPLAVPEPSTYALMGLGLAGVAVAARRRKAA